MPHPNVRNRIVAGAFLLAMLAAAVAVIVLVGGWRTWLRPTQMLKIHFASAPNLKVGSPVLLAGHPVGSIDEIHLVEVPSPPGREAGKCYHVEVVAVLPKAYSIHQNARAIILQALVGQSASINIEDIGFGAPVKGFLMGEQESPFAGAASILGIGQKEKEDISEILTNFRAAMIDFRTVAADAKALLATTRNSIATTVQNLKETSAHLKALAQDVRRSPWRLLARPDVQEVESRNLYDAARAFSQAASDLDAVSDTLQTMIEAKQAGAQVDPEVLQGMQKRLEETFNKYQDAEKALIKEFERIQK